MIKTLNFLFYLSKFFNFSQPCPPPLKARFENLAFKPLQPFYTHPTLRAPLDQRGIKTILQKKRGPHKMRGEGDPGEYRGRREGYFVGKEQKHA